MLSDWVTSAAAAVSGCQGNQVESAIKRLGDKDVCWSAQGMLRLMPAAMRRLYRPTLDAVNAAIARVLDDKHIPGTLCCYRVAEYSV